MQVFSTAYLPYISYCQLYLASHNPVIDLGEHYIKQTQRNRGSVGSSSGALLLTVPLSKTESKRVGDMQISYTENWQKQHIKTIRSCYKNSPYYEHYQFEFEAILTTPFTHLYQLNEAILKWLLHELDIPYKHTFSNSYIENGIVNDYRNEINITKAPLPYKQVFSDRIGFCKNLSCIDLLFNKGPEALMFIQ